MADYIKVGKYLEDNDKFAKGLQIGVDEVELGYSKCSFNLVDKHRNAADVAHGGVIFALVDFAIGVAASTYGFKVLTANASISYIAVGKVSPITAVAQEVSKSKRLSTYEVKVYDGTGELIALSQATMYKLKEELPVKFK